MVARCNNRAFHFTSPEDFAVLREHLREMDRKYEVVLFAYTLMANHVHLLLQAPTQEALGRPLRWLLLQPTREKAIGSTGA
ncbi:MAG TPA: transposase [Candidatus Methylomirabilis sp.]|nr:transposase [Candidatus Methylomirabilis sp.]